MESIFDSYKNNEITIEDVYRACKCFQSKDIAFASTCLTLITAHPPHVLLRRYNNHVADILYNEPKYVYDRLYDESPRLAYKFLKQISDHMLIHPIDFILP